MDLAELSIGTVEYKPLNYKKIVKAKIVANVRGDVFNNELFFYLIERSTVRLSKRRLHRLSVADHKKLRAKTVDILTRHGIIGDAVKQSGNSKRLPGLAPEEEEQMDEMLDEAKQKINIFTKRPQ